jgi:hypothetical protein
MRVAVSTDVVRIALSTALVVGTVLNGINHWQALASASRTVPWGTVLLNYVVPYCVSTWSACALKAK